MNIALIIGCARSGTSILGELISAHPDVKYIFEAHAVWELGGTGDNESHRLTAKHATPEVISAIRQWFQEQLNGDRGLLVEKCPRNVLRVPYLVSIFPEAKIIHIIRDGRDVACSMTPGIGGKEWLHLKPPSWRQLMASYEGPLRAAMAWKEIMEIGLDDLSRVPHLQIRYEDLVLESAKTAEKVLSYLGLCWHESVEAFCKKIQNETGGSYQARHQEIWYRHDHQRRIGRWRENLTPEDLRIIQSVIGPHLEHLGYSVEGQVDKEIRKKPVSVSIKRKNKVGLDNVQKESGMVCCISGMHRSGTSMVARLLSSCGLYLGTKEELLKPNHDNPEGFWENIYFMNLNNRILEKLRGSWDLPPQEKGHWEEGKEFDPLKAEARILIDKYAKHKLWGWKDPRNSLTLPFWKSICPEMKIIICLRNPIEVAMSLQRRGGTTDIFAYNLWYIYNKRLLSCTNPTERIVTHYDSYFINPENEIKRILSFIGVEIDDIVIKKACSNISFLLKHNAASLEDLLNSSRVPEEVKELYLQICEESGYKDFSSVKGVALKHSSIESEGDSISGQSNGLIENGEKFMDVSEGKLISVLEKEIDNETKILIREQQERIIALERALTGEQELTQHLERMLRRFKDTLPVIEHLLFSLKRENTSDLTDVVIGELCFSIGMISKAREFFERALQKNPSNPEALNNLGVISFQLGDYRAAEDFLTRALSINSEHEEAKKNLMGVRERLITHSS